MDLQSIKRRFGIVGNSEGLNRAIRTAMQVANTDLTVLIEGESGVGKEVIHKIIHELSKRKHGPSIAINTGAIPEGTINSELFGHDKGAFTGATTDRKGYFETVDGGTIFLDEIGEMPLDTQAYLLRVLESGEYIKVGSSKVNKTDVRIIAATNVDLLSRINKGKFRDDLYYRLNTVPIRIPALYERREDIHILFRKFATDFAGKYRTEPIRLTEDGIKLIETYRWPGNIRELRNLVEQLSVLSEDQLITKDDLLKIAPKLANRNLPSIPEDRNAGGGSFEEREILYKVLFDMKKDMTDLKSLVFNLIKSNDLDYPETTKINTSQTLVNPIEERFSNTGFTSQGNSPTSFPNIDDSKPVFIDNYDDNFKETEIVEENLSLEDKTVELIEKALKKHKGRRKDAAEELGISERTLYRKIKEHNIAE